MNSYYSNRIEGQHTWQFEIEQALRQDFSADRDMAAKQRLAVAQIDVGVGDEGGAGDRAVGGGGWSVAALMPRALCSERLRLSIR